MSENLKTIKLLDTLCTVLGNFTHEEVINHLFRISKDIHKVRKIAIQTVNEYFKVANCRIVQDKRIKKQINICFLNIYTLCNIDYKQYMLDFDIKKDATKNYKKILTRFNNVGSKIVVIHNKSLYESIIKTQELFKQNFLKTENNERQEFS